MNTILMKRLLLSCASLSSITLIDPALAQADQDSATGEIIVTATKRSESIQNVPFSINALTAEQMQKSGASSMEDVARNVAGLSIQNLGPGQSQVAIRGVASGQVVRDQPGVKEQVGVYLDDSVISLSLFTPDFDLFDLNRVETLRGPQGTLFGSGSEGGTVRYITNQPKLGATEGTVEAGASVLTGGDMGYTGKAMVNVPVGTSMALRAVGYAEHYAGFVNSIGPVSGKNINDGWRAGGRVSLTWKPTPDVSITPRVIYQEIKTNGFNREDVYNLYYNTLISSTNVFPEKTQYLKVREGFQDKTTLADLNISADLSDSITATSVTSYTHRDILVTRDSSPLTGSVVVMPFAIVFGVDGAAADLPSKLLDTTKLDLWTQELRLASRGSGPFQWVLGGFYSHAKRVYAQRLPTPGIDQYLDDAFGAGTAAAAANGFGGDSPYNADIPYVIKQVAVFGEASYTLNRFKLTAGGRYYDFSETRNYKTGGFFANGDNVVGDKTSSSGFTPRVIASYEAAKGVRINVQASKGFRLGGVNDNLLINLCDGGAAGPDAATYGGHPTFNDESLWNYEAGIKASYGKVRVNGAVFYNDIKNLQITADAGSCQSRVIFNVPKAHTVGAEFELGVTPVHGLDLSISGSYVDSQIDSTITDPGGNVIAGIQKGNRLPTVPKFQFAVSASYSTRIGSDLDWSVTISDQYVGDRYTQLADQTAGSGTFTNSIYYNSANGSYGVGAYTFGSYKLPSYNLVNISTGINTGSGLSVTLYANNIFDKVPLFSLDRERGGLGRLGYNIGTPRRIGVTVRQTF